jgi:superoxide reductase
MATERLQVYKCERCGNIIEILHGGGPVPVCCHQDMTLQSENTVDAAQEKHVPVIQKVDGGYLVKVGEVAHPMEQKHSIEWIELVADGTSVSRKYLKPGDAPEATFKVEAGTVGARAYCNLHGLWKS